MPARPFSIPETEGTAPRRSAKIPPHNSECFQCSCTALENRYYGAALNDAKKENRNGVFAAAFYEYVGR